PASIWKCMVVSSSGDDSPRFTARKIVTGKASGCHEVASKGNRSFNPGQEGQGSRERRRWVGVARESDKPRRRKGATGNRGKQPRSSPLLSCNDPSWYRLYPRESICAASSSP